MTPDNTLVWWSPVCLIDSHLAMLRFTRAPFMQCAQGPGLPAGVPACHRSSTVLVVQAAVRVRDSQ